MSLYTLGLNHTTAPLEVRERVTFAPDALSDALRDLIGARRVKEAAILSTCNRTEVYFRDGEPEPSRTGSRTSTACPRRRCRRTSTRCRQDKAVTHAFRVASGLDSMVLGEPQILGQMKQAVRMAESAGSLGLVLNRLFQRTFAVAKDVRTQTDIGSASISMAAAAVKLAERIFPSIGDQRLLLIGAGEMIELAANALRRAKSPKTVTVANRTLERGSKLADRFGADAITLNELPDRLPQFDIIVTCTASTLPILGKGMLERVIKQRRHAPVFIVDLAVPRDVEPEAGDARRRVPLHGRRPGLDREGQPADPPRVRRAGRGDDRRPDRRISCAGSTAAASCRRSPRCPATSTNCARASSSARAACSRTAPRRSGARRARARAHEQAPACAARRRSTRPATPSAPS